jgi:hypothetical protein
MRERIHRTWTTPAAVAAMGLILGLGAADGAAAKSGKGKRHGSSRHVSALVVNPAGMRTADSDLTIEQPEADGLVGAVEVSSSTTGTGHWVHVPVSLAAATHSGRGRAHDLFVVGVEICHREVAASVTPPAGTFIDTVRLSKLESPEGSEIEHEDTTDRGSDTATCFQSPVAFPFPLEGALTLSLALSFGDPGAVFQFGALRILLSPKGDRARPSEPSEPSEPSGPSAPSGPSEPSHPRSSRR